MERWWPATLPPIRLWPKRASATYMRQRPLTDYRCGVRVVKAAANSKAPRFDEDARLDEARHDHTTAALLTPNVRHEGHA